LKGSLIKKQKQLLSQTGFRAGTFFPSCHTSDSIKKLFNYEY